MDCLFSVGSGRRSRIELEAAGLGFGNRSFSNHADPGTRAADPDLHCSDSNRRRQALKDQMSFEGTLTKTVRYRSVFQESVQRPRGVLREPISLSVTCYSFYIKFLRISSMLRSFRISVLIMPSDAGSICLSFVFASTHTKEHLKRPRLLNPKIEQRVLILAS